MGELNDGKYALEVVKSSEELGHSGKLNITSTFDALKDFLAQYEMTRDPAEPNALRTTFGAVFNDNQLVDGTYQWAQSAPGTQRHTLDLQNPLHPFDADLTYADTGHQSRVDFTITSQRGDNTSVSGWAQRSTTAGGRSLSAELTLPERRLAASHSVERSGPVYRRAARLELSPEAFVGYQLAVTSGTERRLEEGGSVRLQLDLPARSLAGAVEAARTRSRRNDVFSSGRARLQFQWDAERQPERQVAAIFNVADLSTGDKMHYNFSTSVDLVGKPVSLETSVQRSRSTPLQLDAAFLYSEDPDSHLTLSYGVVDQSRGSKRVFRSTLFVGHPVSRLSVTGKGLLEVARGTLKVSGSYTYLDIEDRTLESTVLLEVDRKRGEFKAEVSVPTMIYELKSSVGLKEYRINGAAIPTEFGSPQTLLATLNRERPLVRLEVLYDPEQAKYMYVTGGMVNNRTVRLEAYRQAGRYRVDDVVLFLRLNHSHLLTSQARWRTELGYELTEWARSSLLASRDALVDAGAAEWAVKSGALESSLEDRLGQELDLLVEEFTSEKSGTVRGDFEDIRFALSESYERNDFYMQTALSYVYGDDDSLVGALLNQLGTWTEELREDLGVINEAVYVRLNEIIEYLRSLVSSSGGGDRTMADTLREVLAEMAEAYNQWAKAVYARTSLRLHQVYTTVTGYVRHRLVQLGQQYEPLLLRVFHHFETHVVEVAKNAINWFYGEFTQSELYAAIMSLQSVVDQLYRDLTERDTVTNVFNYTKKLARWLYTQFGLEDVLGEPGLWLKDAWDNPPPVLAKVKEFIVVAYEKVSSLVEGLTDVAQHLFAKIYRDGDKFWTQTAIQGAQRYFEGKSIMEMNPDRGYISFIQLLPMPWYGLNQSPVWEELPELQQLRYLQSFTEDSSKESGGVYDFIYDYWPGSNPMDWMPPFKGYAVLSGSSTFVTFDGRLYTFRSDCTYLLAADLLNDRFSVEATFRRRGPASKTISVNAGGHTVELGGPDGYRMTADGRPADAPLEVGELRVVRSGDLITVSLPGWLELRCNQRSDVCALQISRWMFGRTGGLFGSLDNEPYTDLQTPDHHTASGPLFAAGWALQRCRRPADLRQPGRPETGASGQVAVKRADGFCRGLLESPRSEYRVCHRLVDPRPFLAACEAQRDERRCVAVRAYVETCQQLGWPLKMPNKCVQCKIGGKTVFEGRTVTVQMEKPATEVVFIVEAKQCNANATHRRSLAQLVRSLHVILRKEGFATTRFAVMAFGGSGVWDEPRVVTVDGRIFNPAKKVPQAFDQIRPGAGGRDVFGALRRAAMLPFTPGVSRTFILLPCSACEAGHMSIDYTTLANAFAEQQITLHVILDGDIRVAKQQNKLVGIDSRKAYTMKDARRFVGDAALLKHVTSPKSELRLCEPLATKQTNGAIFSSSKLSPHPTRGKILVRPRKRFLAVLGRRVAETARPVPWQSCECATDVEGTVRPLCMPRSSDLLPLDPEDDIFFEDA